jgi:hypothetical protein
MNSFIQKSFQWFSIKLFSNLFVVWFILIPFDAYLLPIDLGPVTIYPQLILTFILLLGSFLLVENRKLSRSSNLFQLFYFIWIVYAVCYYPFVKGKYEAIHEIRSLFLMGATITILLRALEIIGRNKFREIVNQLSYLVFIFLVFVGFLEFFSGIHFKGYFTEKLINLSPGPVTYAPVFLYDNPNNYLVYLFSFGSIFLLTKQKINSYLVFSNLLILLFFSVAGDSKFGKITVLFLFIAIFIPKLWIKFRNTSAALKRAVLILIAILALFIVSKPLYFGPIWKDNPNYLLAPITPLLINENKLTFINKDSLINVIGKDSLHKTLVEYRTKNTIQSTDLRRNLILNGIYLTQISNYFGVGPGQFQWYHSHNLVPNNSNKITNPHESNIEIVSQYGIIVLMLFAFFILHKLNIVLKSSLDIKNKAVYIAICFTYVFISDMPSSWLVLNIAWVFTAVIFLFPDLILNTSNEVAE